MKDEIEKPTVGRVVYVYANTVLCQPSDVPMAAVVADVSELEINAAVINHDGSTAAVQHIPHVSLKQGYSTYYWDWMPYQKSQAAKTAQLQAELDKKTGKTLPENWTRQPPHDAPYKLNPGESAELSENGDMRKLQASAPSPVDGKR